MTVEKKKTPDVLFGLITSHFKYTEPLPFDGIGNKCFCDLLDIKMGVHCHMHDLRSGDQNLLPAENQLRCEGCLTRSGLTAWDEKVLL